MNYPANLSKSDQYWFDLVQQCRTSGKSDSQWLQENNIKSPTFYYHLKRLRQKACEIPEASKNVKAEIQEVVPIFFDEMVNPEVTVTKEIPENDVAIRLQIHGIQIEILGNASHSVIQNTLSALHAVC